jgi:hypothetical protein
LKNDIANDVSDYFKRTSNLVVPNSAVVQDLAGQVSRIQVVQQSIATELRVNMQKVSEDVRLMWKEIQAKSSSSNVEHMLLELERQKQSIK